MRILYCDSVLDRKIVEPLYADEYKTAKVNGITADLISHEALIEEQNVRKALSLVKTAPEEELGIYRGWMMRPEDYAQLYDGLLTKQIKLINTPEEYANCHLFPESYDIIESHTPKSIVIPASDIDNDSVLKAALGYIHGPAIVKDYVKSLKHYWEEACYIPDSSDLASALTVIRRFIELQGSSLVGGLVLRECVNLHKLTDHSQSGMPLSEEYRIFFLNGEVLQIVPYWEEGEYEASVHIPESLLQLGKEIQSNFFTMDVAKLSDGGWIIMELGDGQVAGLPNQTDMGEFYRKLST